MSFAMELGKSRVFSTPWITENICMLHSIKLDHYGVRVQTRDDQGVPHLSPTCQTPSPNDPDQQHSLEFKFSLNDLRYIHAHSQVFLNVYMDTVSSFNLTVYCQRWTDNRNRRIIKEYQCIKQRRLSLGSRVPNSYVVSAMTAQHCTQNIPFDSELYLKKSFLFLLF